MPEAEQTPRVDVTKDGPYRVYGGAALVRTAQVETEYGEPVDWEPDAPIETRTAEYDLCRCGNCSQKHDVIFHDLVMLLRGCPLSETHPEQIVIDQLRARFKSLPGTATNQATPAPSVTPPPTPEDSPGPLPDTLAGTIAPLEQAGSIGCLGPYRLVKQLGQGQA